MRSKPKEREETPRTYRLIHSKNTPKRQSTYENEKNSQYFPGRAIKRQIENHYLDSSNATYSNKEYSDSSRGTLLETTASSSLKQENKTLKKEVQKLSKEMLRLQKLALEKEDKRTTLKKLETELQETYRVIYYYQSKTKELQKTCRNYEQTLDPVSLSASSKDNKISQLLEQQRNHNIELCIELDKKDKQIDQMTNQIGNLSLQKVEFEYQIKILEKERQAKKAALQNRPKFVDDYEQEHLVVSKSSGNLIKKRPGLSRSKKIVRASGQSSEEQSLPGNEYKSTFYVKKGKLNNAVSDRESSPNTSTLKATMYGNLNSKINSIEREMEGLKKENEKLNHELNSKLTELLKLKTSNQELEMKVVLLQEVKNKQKNQNEPVHTLTIAKDKLKEIPKPTCTQSTVPPVSPASQNTENQLSMFVSNISRNSVAQQSSSLQEIKPAPSPKKLNQTHYKRSQIGDFTLRKLMVNVIKSDLSYQDLISTIATCWSSEDPNSLTEELQGAPCSLSSQQTSQFMFEYKQIVKYLSGRESKQAQKDMSKEEYQKYISGQFQQVMQDVIPPFKNITFRREFSINIQLSNKFKNYEEEFNELVQKYENRMPLKECEDVLVGRWGLSEEEFLCLLVKNNEENGGIQFVQIADLGNFYLAD